MNLYYNKTDHIQECNHSYEQEFSENIGWLAILFLVTFAGISSVGVISAVIFAFSYVLIFVATYLQHVKDENAWWNNTISDADIDDLRILVSDVKGRGIPLNTSLPHYTDAKNMTNKELYNIASKINMLIYEFNKENLVCRYEEMLQA